MEEELKNFSDQFPVRPHSLLMNNAAISPLPYPAEKAILEFVRKLQGDVIFDHLPVFAVVDECREKLSQLLNCPSSRIAITGNCASAISLCAFGIHMRPGDKILLWDQEYPSNGFPWIEMARRENAEVEILKSKGNLDLDHHHLIEKIKPGVKVVALSWVQFQSGVTSPLPEIAKACRRIGAWLIVDVFQGVGVIPFDFKASGVHAACGGSHKWLSGPSGSGYLALDDELFENIDPNLVGANTFNAIGAPFDPQARIYSDARRFEPGAPAILNLAGWSASLSLYLEAGIEKIHRQAMDLSHQLIHGLLARNFSILGTQNFAKRESPIVTFRDLGKKPVEDLYEDLKAQQVAFSPRAGGVRLSPHGFNKRRDIERFFEILDARR
jgi:cysteine desulfurase/selenocysteine lyase